MKHDLMSPEELDLPHVYSTRLTARGTPEMAQKQNRTDAVCMATAVATFVGGAAGGVLLAVWGADWRWIITTLVLTLVVVFVLAGIAAAADKTRDGGV